MHASSPSIPLFLSRLISSQSRRQSIGENNSSAHNYHSCLLLSLFPPRHSLHSLAYACLAKHLPAGCSSEDHPRVSAANCAVCPCIGHSKCNCPHNCVPLLLLSPSSQLCSTIERSASAQWPVQLICDELLISPSRIDDGNYTIRTLIIITDH